MRGNKTHFPHKTYDQYTKVTHYEKDQSDNVYFNIEIRGPQDSYGTPAIYDVQRTIPIIEDASKYYASIIRFNVPNFFVPIHVMPIQSDQGDANLSQYSITIEFDGDVQHVFLDFDTRGPFPEPIPPNQTSDGKQFSSPYYFMFEYQHMADMINDAFSTAFAALATVPPTIGGDPPAAPVITFEETTNLFSIIAQQDYYEYTRTLPDPIRVYFNGKLFTIFSGFPDLQTNVTFGALEPDEFSPSGRDNQILISDYFNNLNLPGFNPPFDGDYLVITQQYASIFDWNPFKRIVFTSGSIPVNGEYVKGAGSSTLKVISDFIPFVTDQVRTVWEFVPEGQYRLIDMVSHEKIDTIDIQVFWVDQNDNFFRIEIPFNQEITIKLAFLNKKLYKNYITREKVDFKREFNR